ncbi:zinc finger protein [Nephila pilipes]|uniref:Zinc finger protein n=1 Tax=Nephila pilipes TaxID=299642 RepID=A0A8X6NED9_NEPPI|nr:zinc finger protein [Nephila pilipes]
MFKAIKRLVLSGLKPHTCKLCNDCYVCHACMRERNQIRQCCYGVSEDELEILHEELRKNFNLLYPNRQDRIRNESDEDISQCKSNGNSSQSCSVKSDVWNSLQCRICGKVFKTEFTLTRHFNAHVKAGEKYKCKTCEKCFANGQDLSKHNKIHKTVENKSRVCMYCEKAFSSYYYLKIHIRRHTGERPFVCEYCNSGFTTKGILKIHYRTHEMQRDVVKNLNKNLPFDSDGEISDQQECVPNIYEQISYKDFMNGELDSETSNDEILNLSIQKSNNLFLDGNFSDIGSESIIVNHREYGKHFDLNECSSDEEPIIAEKDEHYKSPFVIKLKSVS